MADDQVNSISEPLVQQAQNTPVESQTVSEEVLEEAPTQTPPTAQEPPLEEEHRIVHLQPNRRQHAIQFLSHVGLQSLLWLQILWTFLCDVTARTQVVSVSVLRGFQGKIYVFFEGSTYPYRIQDHTLAGAGVPPVDWYYDADKKLFLSSAMYNTTSEYNSQHFEWLSGQIKYNNLLLHDISDYLQQTKWVGTRQPSPAHILSAWSLHSGIVLHFTEGIQLHTINQDATESVLAIRG